MLLAVRTVDRSRDFADHPTYIRTIARAAPECSRAQYNLGELLRLEGRPREADAAYTAAIDLGLRRPEENRHLSAAFNQRGLLRYQDASVLRAQGGSGRESLLAAVELFARATELETRGESGPYLNRVAAGLAGLSHSLVDVSHAYATFAVAGVKAAEAINAGCALDLWPQVFQAGHATRTLLGKAEIILARPGEARAFEITCARSYAAYVRDFLREAARGAG